MARKRKPVADALLYWSARFFLGALGTLPLPLARRVAMAIGRVALALVPRLYRVGGEQLDLAYGDTLSPDEKRVILREAMDNMAIVAAEFAHGPKLAAKQFPNVKAFGREHVDTTRGALLISGHLANWEWLASVYALAFSNFAEVVRPFDYEPLNVFIDANRRAMGIGTIPKTGAATAIFQMLRDGGHIGILIDQSPRDSAVPVKFFGHDCWATIGPAMIAARARVPAHFVALRRMPDYSYECEISPALPFISTGNVLQDILVNTQMSQDLLEKFVREHPGQWLWFHRRWKRRPRLEEEWKARLLRVVGRPESSGNPPEEA